jgi:hypothetical protein
MRLQSNLKGDQDMKKVLNPIVFVLIILILPGLCSLQGDSQTVESGVSAISPDTVRMVIGLLIQTHGEAHRFRIVRGVTRAAAFWRKSDL